MDIAARFELAMQPGIQPRCIGLQLRPYSLGHHLALSDLKSCFLTRFETPIFSDLILGVLICSQTWEEWQALQASWKFKWYLRIWGWLAGKFDIEAEMRIFSQYVEDGEWFPETVERPNRSPAQIQSLWENVIKIRLMKELGLSESDLLNRPLQRTFLDYCALGEMDGSIQLLSEADEKVLEFHHNRMKASQKN